jgi:galactonate dehydratase
LAAITEVRYHIAHPPHGKNLLFVRLETDEGLHGWGECYTQSDRDTQVGAHIDQMKRYLIGRDSRNIKHFTDVMFNDFAARRGALDYYSAVSGLEQALWDIAGKRAGQPVYRLLGGAYRERIRVYANGWARANTHAELAQRAREVVGRGFTALKFDPNPGPWRTYVSRADEDEAVERVRVVREAVGPDVEVLVEMHRRLAPMHAVRIAKRIEPYRPFWFEEPVLAENIDALAAVKREVSIPVVTGEELYTKFEFRPVFEAQAADIINPDICSVGGILEMKEIAAMAEVYFVAVSPHNFNSTTVGLAATIHAAATMPNFLITEYFVNLEEWGRGIVDQPFEVRDSYIDLPQRPGLGIEIDEAALQRSPYELFPARAPRTPAQEGP